MKNITKIENAIDRIRTRDIDHSSGGIRVEGRRYQEAFEMCKLIASEAKPLFEKVEAELAALNAVAEAAAELRRLQSLSPVERGEEQMALNNSLGHCDTLLIPTAIDALDACLASLAAIRA